MPENSDAGMPVRPTLVVLAAGMGSRYGGLKQIDPVGPNGESILEYSVFDAIRAGFGKLVFVIRRDIEDAFKEAIGKKFDGRIQVEYAFQDLNDIPEGFEVPAERKKPWGTAHAIMAAEKLIQEPFSVINADDFYGQSAFKQQAQFLSQPGRIGKTEFALVGYILRYTLSEFGSVSRGVCRCDDSGFLKTLEELTKIEKSGNGACYTDDAGQEIKLTGDEICSMNMWGFTPELFKYLNGGFVKFLREQGNEPKSEYFIPEVLNEMIAKGQGSLKVFSSEDSWFGITYPQDKTRVVESIQELVNKGTYPAQLWD